MAESALRRWLLPLLLFGGIALAAVTPIRNYDLFWHLATGRWIVEHRALPLSDPFALASERHEWINGEWLFQVGAFALERIAGISGLSWLRGLFAALLFTLAFLRSRREGEEPVALLLTAIAFAGIAPTLDFRPASIAALFVLLAISTRSLAGFTLLTAIWMNVHPSALLAPLIALVREAGEAPGGERLRLSARWPRFVLASAAALLVTPHGLAGVVAPLRLMSWVGSGAFVNAEWLPSPPARFPLLYICIAAGALAFAFARDRAAGAWRIVLFAGLAWLAARHVRNQPLFFAAFPLLCTWAIPRERISRPLAIAASVAAVALIGITADHRRGVAPERFPTVAVARLQASGLKGNVYNPDQFGGLLIWSFYPERRVLTDGRNELYRRFIPEYARARGDERAWRALLAKYRVDLAVDEYRDPLPVIDAGSGKTTLMPASLAYWPRQEWALIAWDEAGMVFARREAWPRETLEGWEIGGVIPDARRP